MAQTRENVDMQELVSRTQKAREAYESYKREENHNSQENVQPVENNQNSDISQETQNNSYTPAEYPEYGAFDNENINQNSSSGGSGKLLRNVGIGTFLGTAALVPIYIYQSGKNITKDFNNTIKDGVEDFSKTLDISKEILIDGKVTDKFSNVTIDRSVLSFDINNNGNTSTVSYDIIKLNHNEVCNVQLDGKSSLTLVGDDLNKTFVIKNSNQNIVGYYYEETKKLTIVDTNNNISLDDVMMRDNLTLAKQNISDSIQTIPTSIYYDQEMSDKLNGLINNVNVNNVNFKSYDDYYKTMSKDLKNFFRQENWDIGYEETMKRVSKTGVFDSLSDLIKDNPALTGALSLAIIGLLISLLSAGIVTATTKGVVEYNKKSKNNKPKEKKKIASPVDISDQINDSNEQIR